MRDRGGEVLDSIGTLGDKKEDCLPVLFGRDEEDPNNGSNLLNLFDRF